MSSTPAAKHPARELNKRIAHEARALELSLWLAAGLAGAATAMLVFAIGVLLFDDGRWLHLPRALPVIAWLSGLASAVAVARHLHVSRKQQLTAVQVTSAVEREQKMRPGSLRGAIEVGDSGALGAYAAQGIAAKLAPVRTLAPDLTRSFTKLSAWAGATALLAGVVLAISSLNATDGFAALRHPVSAWRGLLLPALSIDNPIINVPRGMPYTLQIRAEGRTRITVTIASAGAVTRDTVLAVNPASGKASLPLGPVTVPLSLVFSDGRSVPLTTQIEVADRGWIGDVVLHAAYPAYLDRTDERLEAIPPVRVPQGTLLRVRAMLRGGAADAFLTNGTDTIALKIDSMGGAAVAEIRAMSDAQWNWSASPTANAATGDMLPVEVPDPLELLVTTDAPPAVAIVAPFADSTIGASGAVAVHVRATDDHGLSSVQLELWKNNSATPGERKRMHLAAPAIAMWEGGATVVLDELALEPGDQLHLVATAVDDSPWKQLSYSAETVLRVPSLSEQRGLARDLADSLASRARQMAAEERQLQQRTSDVAGSRDMQGNTNSSGSSGDSRAAAQKNAMSYAAAERAKELGRQQQEMGSRVDSLRRQTQDLEDRLRNAGALDSAMQNRMRDIQRMLREAMTPEMQQQLQELQKSLERLSGSEAQKSLEQLAQQQQQMREQLEKSAEMLQRAALEGAMQTLSDEAKDLAREQKDLASGLKGEPAQGANKGDPRTVADRTRALERDVDKLAKRLDEAGAKPGADKTRAAQPDVGRSADEMQRAANESKTAGDSSRTDATDSLSKSLADAKRQTDDSNTDATKAGEKTPPGASGGTGSQAQQQKNVSGSDVTGNQRNVTRAGQDATRQGQQGSSQQGAQQQGSQQQGSQQQGQQGGQQQGSQQSAGQPSAPNPAAAQHAADAASAMSRAAQQLADARQAQVDAWKDDLSQQLDRSINETQQLARQQAELEQRLRQEGASAVRGDQGAVQQGVQQAAERLEQAGRSSSLLSQRSQKAMGEAQRKVQDATQSLSNAMQGTGQEGAQSAMRDATDALNQALSSLVRDRERVNNAQSASGFSEMMEQMRQLAQQQGALNGQMQGLSMLPGGMQGQQAQQQSRVLARQQRDVARTLQDVSDADASGRTDALAKEAQQIAQVMERQGLDPSVAARQEQLYRRLLDAGRFLEQDEHDNQGPREARAGSGQGAGNVTGPATGKTANRFAPPTWNDLRGLGAEERRIVIEYFRRINSGNP